MWLEAFRLQEDSTRSLFVLAAFSESAPSAALAPVPQPEQPTEFVQCDDLKTS